MKCKSLKQLWGDLFRKKKEESISPGRQAEALRVTPLTAGLRIDLTVPHGSERELSASQFIWVSPAGSKPGSVKALRVLLIPN
ncbi:MAG: hypothetical protein PVJ76_15745 [Gemmatimonadota bacterium]|jgi:hypothetical protein